MKISKYIILVLSVLLHSGIFAQIKNTNANYEGIVHNTIVNDSTFIFTYFASNPNPLTVKAVTTAPNPSDFKWYRFINSSQTIDPTPFRVDNNMIESIVPVSEGGYMVTIDNGVVTDTFRTWIFYDIMNADSISRVQDCDTLYLTAHVSANRNNFSSYEYYDFCDLNQVFPRFMRNNFTLAWDASTDIYAGLPDMSQGWKSGVNTLSTRIPYPLRDASYTAIVTNIFGNKSNTVTTATIPAISAYSLFDVLVANDMGVFQPTTELNGEALYRLKLENKSVNADKFEWIGWNNQEINFLKNDTLWRYNTETIFDEINYTPGKYPIQLTVEKTASGCRHSKKVEIVVQPSSFDPSSLPNAFTPNGDGSNDFFTFVTGKEPVSMRTMDLKIFSRNGNLVYKYQGEISSWEGWNGKMNGKGSDCSSGVYYYVISGDGWDDKSYSGKSYTGVLHLFRGK